MTAAECLVRLTTVSEGPSGCVVDAGSARPLAESIAAAGPADPDLLRVEVVTPAGAVDTIYQRGDLS